MQTWLYFGILHEAVGPRYETACFIEEGSDGEKLLTACHLEQIVKEWTLYLVREESVRDINRLVEQCTHIYNCLIEARGTSLRLILYDPRPIDLRIMMAVAALCEYLLQAIKDVYIHLGMESPIEQSWRIPGLVDMAQVLFDRMRHNGWCPFDLARIDSETRLIGVLNYYSNLPPPRFDRDHSKCSKALCTAMQIDPKSYALAHTTKCSECPLQFVDQQRVEDILKSDSIPLVTSPTSDNSTRSKIITIDACDEVEFVAISHVWAEGLGNPSDNALHSCLLAQLSILANKLPKKDPEQTMPFWIDTICVPVRPPEMQNLALNKMREPYERAKHVLVLDSYIQSVDSKVLSPLEVFSRITHCSWGRRLWTLQEGRLARNIWFQFRDQAIDLRKLFDSMDFTRIPSLVSRYLELDVVFRYGASKIHDRFASLVNGGIPSLRTALSIRSVSVSTDEALCLACLMGLDMKKITAVSLPDRMKVFWSLLSKAPVGLVFSRTSKKLNYHGFHWAPSTFLGLLPKGHWAGPQGLDDNRAEGIITGAGLLVKLPGYTLHPNLISPDKDMESTFKHDVLLQDPQNIWYALNVEEPWGESSSNLKGPQTLGLILAMSTTSPEAAARDAGSPLGIFNIRNSVIGVLARTVKREGTIIHTKVKRHVLFQKLGEGYQTYLNEAKSHARRILSDEKATNSGIANPSEEKCKQAAEEALRNSDFLHLCEAEASHYGASKALDAMIEAFSGMILRFCRFGDRNLMERTADDQQWCVD